MVEAVIDQRDLIGEGRQLGHKRIEFEDAHLVLRAHHRMHKLLRRLLLHVAVLVGAGTGIDGQREIQRHFGLALKDCDGLRAAIFGEFEILLRKATNDRALLVGDIDEQAYQLHIEAKRLVFLPGEAKCHTQDHCERN